MDNQPTVQEQGKRRKFGRFLNWLVTLAIAALAVWGIVGWVKRPAAEQPGEAVSIQPADHVKVGDIIPGIYLTNPPVSGWHYADTAEWGVYEKELSDQLVIHNLEHGGIWISYKIPDASFELIGKLKAVAERYKIGVILTPRAANDSLIALAAWGRLDKFDYFDEARIIKFIKAYKDKGPEPLE